MDWFLDKLNSILNSLDNLFDDFFEETYSRRYFTDRDFREAWEELEEFIRVGKFSERLGRNTFGEGFTRGFTEKAKQSGKEKTHENKGYKIKIKHGDSILEEDYNNLGVSLGASLEDVKRSYKKLLKKYHPDNYPDDSEKQKLATEITKKLNISYQRIKQYKQNNKI